MLHVHFKISLVGLGETVDDCWRDAIEGFNLDPGITPDKDEYEIIENSELARDAELNKEINL